MAARLMYDLEVSVFMKNEQWNSGRSVEYMRENRWLASRLYEAVRGLA
jgi:hypothetical protein